MATATINGVEVGNRVSNQPERSGDDQHFVTIGARIMDKDRIAGAAHEVKGSVKEAVGKAVGDAKLRRSEHGRDGPAH